MSWKHWMRAALVLVLALGACKKKQEEQSASPSAAAPEQPGTPSAGGETSAPAQPGGTAQPAAQPTPPATPPSPETTQKTLEALDDSIEKLAEGFGGALDGLPMAGKRAAAPTGAESPGAPGEAEEPVPIARVQMHFDLAGLRASPVGPMIQNFIQAAQAAGGIPANQACLVSLANKVESAFIDVQVGDSGDEPKALVVAFKTGSTKDEVVGCMRSAVQEGHEFAEVPVAGRTGYTVQETGEAPEMVMVEATPGNWLVGPQASVEAALQADPQADPRFQTLTGPLGAGIFRMAIVPSPSFAALANEIEEDAPPPAQCARGLFTAFKGGSVGVRLTPDLAVSFAMQNGSAAEAVASQSCLAGLWAMAKPVVLSEMGEGTAEAQQLQGMLGLTPQQLLDRVQIQAQGEFTTISLSLPPDVLTKLMQMVASLATGHP